MKIPITIQMTAGENGPAALSMILGYFGRYVEIEELREVCICSRNGTSLEQLKQAAEHYGLKAEIRELDVEQFKTAGFPLVAQWKRKYYAIVKSVKKDWIYLVDPAKGEYRLPIKDFKEKYSGTVLAVSKGPEFKRGGKKESLFSLLKDRLKKIIKPMIWLLILTLLCIDLDMIISQLSRYVLDNFIEGNNSPAFANVDIPKTLIEYKEVLFSVTMFAEYLLVILLLIVSFRKTALIYKTSRNMSAESGSQLFNKMFAQPLKFFEQYSAGELMQRLDNNVKLDNSLMRTLVPRTIDAVMTLLYIGMLVEYNVQLALICLGVELVTTVIILLLQERSAIVARSMATTNGALSTSILNGMNMIETIKSTGSESSFFKMWYDSQYESNESKLKSISINRSINTVNNINSTLLQGIQLFVGAYMISKGRFTLGMMSLFQSVLNKMRNSFNNCLSSVNTLQTMRTNIERVNDINKRPTRPAIPLPEGEEPNKLEGTIKVEHVTYRYNAGDDPAIDDVSLEVLPGQMVALVGSTGCGKSTLLKLMADLYTPESGEIYYSGKKRSEIPDVVFHSSVMSVDQESVVFEDSVYANIKMWDSTIEDYEVVMAARDAQIHDRIMRDSDDYRTMVLENGRNYSGGELQRIELARALAHEPTLLFLDEFTSALDALTEDRVLKAIRDKGTTSVIVAHRLSTIVDCDMIYVLDNGRIVQQGTHDELFAQEGLYRTLISNQ